MWANVVRFLFPWMLRKAMTIGAKAFRKHYSPQLHAQKSRKYMWDNYWSKLRTEAGRTVNKFDDIGADFVYHYNAGYIEDGTLMANLRIIERCLEYRDRRDDGTIRAAVDGIRSLIEYKEEK